MEGRVLRCPWHAWEFDITTGKSLFAPEACRVKSYEVAVESVVVETFRAEVEGEVVVVYA
jgi:3-phenylpropionate/trans-cinnamate dioxygenase ferredoxin subunit